MKFAPFLFFLFSLFDYIHTTNKAYFSYQPLVVECLILLVYILYFFYEKIQITTTIPIYQTRIFWIILAFTFYSSGNFFLFLYANNTVKNQEFVFQYTMIYSTFTILKNVFLCIALVTKEPNDNYENNPINFKDLLDNEDFLNNASA